MATRFVRIDLSDAARDYRRVAVEPGLPLLDKAGANARIVFRWVGGLAAEPQWDGESVNFFVRDDHGGRLEEAICYPATGEDLQSTLKHDVELLRDRLRKAVPESSTERALHRVLTEILDSLIDRPQRADLDSFFFRYRDVQGRWRLIWCWGYQRADQEPATTVVCTDPECGLLFVRRPGQSPKCPSCEALLAAKQKRRTPRKKSILAGLLLFLLGAALVYWWLSPERLVVTPEEWTGPVGGRVEFRLARRGLFRSQDVSRHAVAVASDPRVVRFDSFGTTATAVNPGAAAVTFYLGGLRATTTMLVEPRGNPATIAIEPQTVDLGIGTTARLRLIGEYEDGVKADLTEAAEWVPQKDGVVYAVDGLLEGLGEGTSKVTVRYRANPESEYLQATTDVSVSKFAIKSMEMAVVPDPVSAGRASDLRIDVVSDAGKSFSVLESSLLKLRVDPPHLATPYRTQLRGNHPGRGRLAATFDDRINAEREFDVTIGPGVDSLIVAPEKLDIIVGEVTDLAIASPSTAPIAVTSSDGKVVEIGRANRLIGRREGNAQVEVAQGADKRTVDVSVTKADIQSIAVRPARVVVPVDHAAPVRVMGRIEGERQVELAPDLIEYDKLPSPRYADFDRRTMEVRGIQPTTDSDPQKIALRFQTHQAGASVDVVAAPLRFELTPPGKVDVPLGQIARLEGWATYGDGLRVQVFPDRIRWKSDPASGTTPGLELREGRIAALKAGAGPLTVWGTYFGNESNRVTLRSVDAGPVDLTLETDRTLRLAGEPGAVLLRGSGPSGDVELVPELAQFKCSDPKTLTIDPVSGEFQALAPGTVAVTAVHPAASKPVSREFVVADPARARLVFEPASVKLAVDEVAPLRLFLETTGEQVRKREAMSGPGVQYVVAQPNAVSWRPPILQGTSPAPPFMLTAAYRPWLQKAASAMVEVTAAAEPAAIRVVPAEVTMAPGQPLALRVEQQQAGSDVWQEVRPEAVAWQVPAALIWAPASGGLRPTVMIPPKTSGSFTLQAEVRGKQAACTITTKEEGPDAAAPGAKLVVQREPEGVYLPVGSQQRYAVVVERDGTAEPAADIRWQPDFENDYVRWQAPVLTAKRAGRVQWLSAQMGGRTLRFYACTYDPARAENLPPPSGDRPVAVKVLSDQGPGVRFPVGAEFDDFRVEAEYADGFTRVVTNKATLRTPESPDRATVAPRDGHLIGLRAGQTVVQAEFEGVASTKGLGVEVTAEVDIDEIRLVPAPLQMMPGETIPLSAVGFKGGKSVGVITGLGGLAWKSSNDQVVAVNGPAVTARQLGQARVTAERGALASQPADVSVVGVIGDELTVDPRMLRIRVGEAIRVGTDVKVTRGPTDLSRECTVYPALKDVLRYDQATQCLVGVAPGTTPVSFIWGKKLADMMVEVQPGGVVEGQVVIEPPAAILAPGQALHPRVFVVTKEGSRIDRTEAAVLSSSAADRVMVRGFRATDRADHLLAMAPGSAEISATVPGAARPGRMSVAVNNEPITDLMVEPPQLDMAVSDRAQLRVLGRAASGTYELFPQKDLKLTAAGPSPSSIKVVDPNEVEAVGAGQAEVAVAYGDRLTRRVPVNVVPNALADLQIDPPQATVHPGQGLVYTVTGTVGGRRRVLGPEDGVQLSVREPTVAQVMGRMTVGGNQPGRTSVVAQLGARQAEAALDVTPGLAGVGTDVVTEGPSRIIQREADGTVWIDGHRYVYRPGRGWGLVDGERVVGPGLIDAPAPAGVASLRFMPDTLRVPMGSEGAPVKLVEVLQDGSSGRDVTSSPGLELTQPPDVARVELTPAGPVIRPVGTGETRIGARLGLLTAETPLKVVVSGDRFTNVETKPNWGEDDFSVTIDVLSANSEGQLEYRVYGDGNPPPEKWVASQEAGANRRVVLESPRMPYRGQGAQYNLIIEARDGAGGIVQRYPFTFRLVRNIERTDIKP
jgi:hypothetical protein